MSRRYYVTPIILENVGSASEPSMMRVPKFWAQAHQLGYTVGMTGYGSEDSCIARLRNPAPTPADHAALIADPEIYAIPEDIEQQIDSGQAASIGNKLEGTGIPGDWIAAGMTWESVLIRSTKSCIMMQGWRGRTNAVNKMFSGGRSLDTLLGQLPPPLRNPLLAIADQHGMDKSQMTLTNTVRDVLNSMSDQYNEYIAFIQDDL